MSLDLTKYQTVFDDNFAEDSSLNKTLWSDSWGNKDQYSFSSSGLTLIGYQDPWWQPVGFMQKATGVTAGEGYGLYQFSGYGNAGQGIGINFIMWRADNGWLDSAHPGTASEIDILESWDKTKSVESTVHYYEAGVPYSDGQEFHHINVDPSVLHTYALEWEKGSITFYVDGQEEYQDTTRAPLDAADGGCNYVMGAQVINEAHLVTTPTVQLHITDMRYSAPVSAATAPPAPPAPPTPSKSVTLGGGTQNYVAAAGVTVQAGSGNDTISAASGQVLVKGSSGTLTFFGGTGPSTVSGGTGAISVFGGSGGGSYNGGSTGNNLLVSQGASGANTTLTGGGANDQLFGSAAGSDMLVAGPGHASILGGGGNTTIMGGTSASSVIFTGSGKSVVLAGVSGGDTVVGGTGSLNVTANTGDAIFGNAGAVNVTGSTNGADSIVGGSGGLTVQGQGGNMLVVGGSGSSNINTGNGASLIFCGSGSGSVTGGSGSMQMVLGSGTTTVSEGTGAALFDVVHGSAAGGIDVLNGFRPGTDQIDLFGYQASEQQVSVVSGSTLISLSDGTRITLVGITDPGSSIVG